MKDGVIADFNVTEDMLKYFIRKVQENRFFSSPRIIICVSLRLNTGRTTRYPGICYQCRGTRGLFNRGANGGCHWCESPGC